MRTGTRRTSGSPRTRPSWSRSASPPRSRCSTSTRPSRAPRRRAPSTARKQARKPGNPARPPERWTEAARSGPRVVDSRRGAPTMTDTTQDQDAGESAESADGVYPRRVGAFDFASFAVEEPGTVFLDIQQSGTFREDGVVVVTKMADLLATTKRRDV